MTEETSAPQHALLERVADVATYMKLLSNEGRLAILCWLQEGSLTVGELEQLLGEKQSTVSQQLGRLRREGLVEATRQGPTMHYRISDPRLQIIMNALHEAFFADLQVTDTGHVQGG